MAIASADELIAGFPGQSCGFVKSYPALQAAGQWYSPWLLAGIPGAGVTPSSGVAGNTLTDATDGAFPFANAASGLLYLARFALNAGVSGMLYIYDRLWHNSGLSTTSLTAQTVNSVTLPSRCPVETDATGETFDALGHTVEPWFQVMGTAMGAGSTAGSISYTDQDGNAGATGTVQGFVTTAAIGRAFPISLAAGDTGVRSIQSYTNGATMTSGVFSLVLRRRLLMAPIIASNAGALLDWAECGMPVIPSDAHLELLWVPTATTLSTFFGDFALIQG